MLNNCFKNLTTRHDEQIMDRYIPSVASNRTHRALPLNSHEQPRATVRDESILVMSQTQPFEGYRALDRQHQVHHSPTSVHREHIADALSFTPEARVLTFSPSSPSSRATNQNSTTNNTNSNQSDASTSAYSPNSSIHHSPIHSMISADDSISIPSRNSMDSNSSFNSSPKSKKPAKKYIPYKILDAPRLRNDFYTNLVSWSKPSNMIAVGLSTRVYVWSQTKGAHRLSLRSNENISCVAFSDYDYLVIGTKAGRVSLYSQEAEVITSECLVQSGSKICCITWMHDSPTKFFVGDGLGYFSIFEVDETHQQLQLVSVMRSSAQEVCGIAVSYDLKQIAVGGNDNCCTIWDIEDLANPKVKFLLKHTAAVKAVAYCPWSKSLLATGGGTRDRHIRFWHTQSGTLVDSVPTQGQITSLIWSRRKKQIVATFGFGNIENPILAAVYSYPNMEIRVQVDATPELRVISAVISPDTSCICAAANDETVRFYELWNPNDNIIKESQDDGVFGSDLIELSEGIAKHGGPIR